MALTVFPIARPSRFRWNWLYTVMGVVLVLPPLLIGLFVLWPENARFEVDATALTVRGSLYGRTIPAAAIRTDGVRRLTSDDTPAIYPKLRTNGIGLPDYQAGWFRLNDDREALLFVTDWSRTMVVPTTSGYDLVASPDDPDALVASIKAPPAQGAAPRIFAMAAVPARGWELSDVAPLFAAIGAPTLTLAVFALVLTAGRNVRFELTDDSLRIRGDIYGRTISRSDLQVAEAAIINMKEHPTFGRMLRTNGIGLPNYCSGWFRPRGGGRALLFVTDRRQVISVPTNAGYQLLLSPANIDDFLAALRSENQ